MGAVVAIGVIAAAAACRAPTQARLVVTTSALCSETNGVAITVKDKPATVARVLDETPGFVTTSTTACAQKAGYGDYGSLILAPGEETGAVLVVAGYGATRAESCTPKNQFKGCIVARRAFSFVDHATITIPVSLDPDCVDVPCDAFSTCRKGACVDSSVSCTESGCTGASLPPPGEVDAGPTPRDGSTDGPPADRDASPDGAPSDGGLDASDGAPPSDGGGGTSRCGLVPGTACRGFGSSLPDTPCGPAEVCCAMATGACVAYTGLDTTSCGGSLFCCSDQADCSGSDVCCKRTVNGRQVFDCRPTGDCESPIASSILCDRGGGCPLMGGMPGTCRNGSFPYKFCTYP